MHSIPQTHFGVPIKIVKLCLETRKSKAKKTDKPNSKQTSASGWDFPSRWKGDL